MAGAPVRKLLFMSDVATIEARTLPALDSMLEGTDASTTQAVETMAEVVPKGAPCSCCLACCTAGWTWRTILVHA